MEDPKVRMQNSIIRWQQLGDRDEYIPTVNGQPPAYTGGITRAKVIEIGGRFLDDEVRILAPDTAAAEIQADYDQQVTMERNLANPDEFWSTGTEADLSK